MRLKDIADPVDYTAPAMAIASDNAVTDMADHISA